MISTVPGCCCPPVDCCSVVVDVIVIGRCCHRKLRYFALIRLLPASLFLLPCHAALSFLYSSFFFLNTMFSFLAFCLSLAMSPTRRASYCRFRLGLLLFLSSALLSSLSFSLLIWLNCELAAQRTKITSTLIVG